MNITVFMFDFHLIGCGHLMDSKTTIIRMRMNNKKITNNHCRSEKDV